MADAKADQVAYVVVDVESVPDGRLIQRVKYPGESCSEEEAVQRFQQELLESSGRKSDFVPVTFHVPIAATAALVNRGLGLMDIRTLGAPAFHPKDIVKAFWELATAENVCLVTFNGRGFDVPLMEITAFRYGLSVAGHFSERYGTRDRYARKHFDLMDWMSNFGASRMHGGLNLLSKLLGKPGKMTTTGDQVYAMFRAGHLQAIRQYCTFDVLDTYFVFLRSQVLLGRLTVEREQRIVQSVKQWLDEAVMQRPELMTYVENWGDWTPWP